ncbi:hypothetical protein E2C01_029096 [Portunus trituberculatus]|uniref:Uncharacterized protein n=1 Tax=Portunus trituberculatus TaxID=210409 RepID=A0A5B7EQY7_PORTR|nr:hypothetical protein [Portunus trituberculatus]
MQDSGTPRRWQHGWWLRPPTAQRRMMGSSPEQVVASILTKVKAAVQTTTEGTVKPIGGRALSAPKTRSTYRKMSLDGESVYRIQDRGKRNVCYAPPLSRSSGTWHTLAYCSHQGHHQL